jgi:S-disulfanyl-L-cysteine oxidoreductase SoxD
MMALIAIAAIWWFGFAANMKITQIQPDNAELVALGGPIYAKQCASCHGKNLEGQVPNWRERLPDGSIAAPPHDPSGHTWHHPDSMLFDVTKRGRLKASGGSINSNMPGFEETLSDREIWAVLSYIKSRWPAPIRLRHDDINRQAAAQQAR